MDLTRVAIDKNRVTIIVTAILILSGLSAFLSLPKAQDPGFTVRTAVITTRLPGASPERLELLVTDKIEKKVQEMPQVDSIESESRNGVSIVTVNFKESYKVMRPIFDELRRKIEDVGEDLPAGYIGPSVNDEFGDVFGSVYGLSGDGYSNAELKIVADEIRDELLKEPDVAKVSIHGAQDEIIFVDYKNSRLTELGLSPKQLSAVLGSENILDSGGSIVSGRERIALEPTGNIESVEALRQTVVELPNGELLALRDIADIYRAYEDPPGSITRINGQSALALAVSMRDGGDILKLGERLDALMPELLERYPWGVSVEKVWFQADLVRSNVGSFISSLGQAIAIVIAVMVLFLGLRTGLVVATLIPATVITSFYMMEIFAITINQISLAALIIALGLLVDNAIVIVESILVKREQGVSALDAAIQSGNELKMPLLVSSLTTAAAFMPIALAESAVGEYTADIFYVVAIALLVSWCLAMTVLPMLSTRALRVSKKQDSDEKGENYWYRLYTRILRWCLGHRLVFGLAVVVIFFVAMKGLGFVRAEFIAPSEDPIFTAKLEMPVGSDITASAAEIARIDAFIRERFYEPVEGEALVKNWMVFTGEGGPRFMLSLNPPNVNPANSFLIVNTVSHAVTERVMSELRTYLFESHPDLDSQVSRLENGPPVGYPIQVRLSAPSIDGLYEAADDVAGLLYANSGVSAVKNSWGMKSKKLLVQVDQERARRAGVSSEDVAFSLKASLSGIDLTEYREGDDLIPVKLRTEVSDRQDISKLDGMSVYGQSSGLTVPLKQVADIALAFEPGTIERRDRVKTLTLSAQLRGGYTATSVNEEFLPELSALSESWTRGVEYELGGESESSGDANASIAAKLPLAFMVILLLLVTQFNSLRRPLIVLATIPLGLIGVTFGLLAVNSAFGFFTILGIISLSGIIINNAIVLLDRIAIEKEEPETSHLDAVIRACLLRLRPIMLTTATTVLGMLPLLWGGSAMFRPMAVTIIFGLIFATLLTLLVVPVLYAAMFRVHVPRAVASERAG